MGNALYDDNDEKLGPIKMLSNRSSPRPWPCNQCNNSEVMKNGHYLCLNELCGTLLCKQCGENDHPKDHILLYKTSRPT